MKRSSNLKRRVREIETAKGAGVLNLKFPDGSEQSVRFSCKNDRLQVLLASFAIAHAEGNPDEECGSSPHALEVARLIARAESVDSDVKLWSTVAGVVRGATQQEEEKKGGTQ